MTDIFQTAFGAAAQQSGFTPGRVNLIGEHTDYNGGMVLPTALSQGLSLFLTPRSDDRVRIVSDKFDGEIVERKLSQSATEDWSDYVLGAIIYANKAGLLSGGADVGIVTTLPMGAGLSSSAATVVGLLKLARDAAGQDKSDTEIAVLARRVENEFIGVPVGIMDQMAVAIATPGQALALDTKSLDFDLVDMPEDYHMAVIHSGVYRQLNEGRYKERKEECDAVKAELGHDDICLISDAEFASLSGLPAHIQRRARHCMTEHRRVKLAIKSFNANDMVAFGNLMVESHISMRDDFEITVPQLDAIVEDAVKFGALGARMTGGGFGGCIVACVKNVDLETMNAQLFARHKDAFFVG